MNTIELFEDLPVEEGIRESIREFLNAIDDFGYLERMECSTSVVATFWKRINNALASVRRLVNRAAKEATLPSFTIDRFRLTVEDLTRINKLFRTQDKLPEFADYWEFDLLVLVTWRVVHPPKYSREVVRLSDRWELHELQETILRAFKYAEKIARLPDSDIPPKRLERTATLLFDEWEQEKRRIEKLFRTNIDRFIYPRLGTNPDQWTTEVARTLLRLSRGLSVFFHDPYLDGRGFVAPSDSKKTETVLRVCMSLADFAADISCLRFDSLLKDEGIGQQKRSLRVNASIDEQKVFLETDDGIAETRVPRNSAIYLKALIEAGGKPISGAAIKKRYPEFPADKVTRLRKYLPKGIQELIDCSTGSGSWLKPEAWQESQS